MPSIRYNALNPNGVMVEDPMDRFDMANASNTMLQQNQQLMAQMALARLQSEDANAAANRQNNLDMMNNNHAFLSKEGEAGRASNLAIAQGGWNSNRDVANIANAPALARNRLETDVFSAQRPGIEANSRMSQIAADRAQAEFDIFKRGMKDIYGDGQPAPAASPATSVPAASPNKNIRFDAQDVFADPQNPPDPQPAPAPAPTASDPLLEAAMKARAMAQLQGKNVGPDPMNERQIARKTKAEADSKEQENANRMDLERDNEIRRALDAGDVQAAKNMATKWGRPMPKIGVETVLARDEKGKPTVTGFTDPILVNLTDNISKLADKLSPSMFNPVGQFRLAGSNGKENMKADLQMAMTKAMARGAELGMNQAEVAAYIKNKVSPVTNNWFSDIFLDNYGREALGLPQ